MYVRTIQHLNYSRQESEKHNLQFIFLSHPSSSMAVEHRPCLLTEKKIQAFETKCLRKLLCISTWGPRPTTGCRARSTSLWVHMNLFTQPSRDGDLHGSSMSHTMTASPKPSFRAPRRMGDAVVGRGNAGWTTSKSGHPCPCHNCSKGPPAEKTGKESLLNSPSCPPGNPIGQGTELK